MSYTKVTLWVNHQHVFANDTFTILGTSLRGSVRIVSNSRGSCGCLQSSYENSYSKAPVKFAVSAQGMKWFIACQAFIKNNCLINALRSRDVVLRHISWPSLHNVIYACHIDTIIRTDGNFSMKPTPARLNEMSLNIWNTIDVFLFSKVYFPPNLNVFTCWHTALGPVVHCIAQGLANICHWHWIILIPAWLNGYLSMLGLKSNKVSKKGHCWQLLRTPPVLVTICPCIWFVIIIFFTRPAVHITVNKIDIQQVRYHFSSTCVTMAGSHSALFSR